MDPNETLRLLRQQAEKLLRGNVFPEQIPDEANQLAEAFEVLDRHLSEKGYLPEDWKR